MMAMTKLLTFLNQLEASDTWYRLEHVRDSVMVHTAIPGERWEIEFFDDGHVEIERFVSTGEIQGEARIRELLEVVATDP